MSKKTFERLAISGWQYQTLYKQTLCITLYTHYFIHQLFHNMAWILGNQYDSDCCMVVGMVQSRSGVCIGWVLCQIRGSRLSPPSMLPQWPPRTCRGWDNDWSYTYTLQFCFLCFTCTWKQVNLCIHFRSIDRGVNVKSAAICLALLLSHLVTLVL